jgi:hypothetical protein
MGKRSKFERREADFYPTPQAAVVPLIPYLRGIRTFAEPCAGDGALMRHLEEFGLRWLPEEHSPCEGSPSAVRPHHDTIGSLTAARRHLEFTPRSARSTNRSCLRISVAGTAHQLHDRSRAFLQWAEPCDAPLYGSQSLGRALQGGSHARPVNLL